jgi:hypothetical protein
LGGGAIADGETRAKHASGNVPLQFYISQHANDCKQGRIS